jgi:hypothetical protein
MGLESIYCITPVLACECIILFEWQWCPCHHMKRFARAITRLFRVTLMHKLLPSPATSALRN